MTGRPTCPVCAVPIHRGSEYEYRGQRYHVPCLIRSLQGQLDAITECYDGLRPHVKDRSVLRGLCRFADVAVDGGRADGEDCSAAIEWLRQAAGREP